MEVSKERINRKGGEQNNLKFDEKQSIHPISLKNSTKVHRHIIATLLKTKPKRENFESSKGKT